MKEKLKAEFITGCLETTFYQAWDDGISLDIPDYPEYRIDVVEGFVYVYEKETTE